MSCIRDRSFRSERIVRSVACVGMTISLVACAHKNLVVETGYRPYTCQTVRDLSSPTVQIGAGALALRVQEVLKGDGWEQLGGTTTELLFSKQESAELDVGSVPAMRYLVVIITARGPTLAQRSVFAAILAPRYDEGAAYLETGVSGMAKYLADKSLHAAGSTPE